MNLLNNPLASPLFIPVIIRLFAVFGAGLILVLIFNIKDLKNTFKSETWIRYVAWLVMAPTFLLSVFSGGIVATLLIGYLMFQAQKEFCKMLNLPKHQYYIILCNSIVSLFVGALFPKLINFLPLFYFVTIVGFAVLRNEINNILSNISFSLFASMWISYSLAHLLLFRNLQNGTVILVLLGFSVALSDICAFSFGKLYAKLNIGTSFKIANKISPNKTVFGISGNLFGSIAAALIFAPILPEVHIIKLLVLSIVIGLATVAGDLTESMVKRFAHVKDSAKTIPGHGGVLDRIDSMLISVVVCYLFVGTFLIG